MTDHWLEALADIRRQKLTINLGSLSPEQLQTYFQHMPEESVEELLGEASRIAKAIEKGEEQNKALSDLLALTKRIAEVAGFVVKVIA